MNGIRKLICYAMTLVAAVYALPSVAAPAPQKLYSIVACVGQFADVVNPSITDHTLCAVDQTQLEQTPTKPTLLQVRIFNLSPPQATNSSINALDLFVDVNWRAQQDAELKVLDNSGKWSIDVTTPNHVKVSGLSPVKPTKYVTVQFNVDGFSCGLGSWDATPYTGSSVGTGAKFLKVGDAKAPTLVACGLFACGNFLDNVQPQGSTAVDPLVTKLERGTYDEDGTTNGTTTADCRTRYAYVTPTITTSSATFQTTWDTDPSDSTAVFLYKLDRMITGLGDILVAWKTQGTSPPVVPDFQPALMCESKLPNLPAPYTTLVEDNGDKITVAPPGAALPAVPFSIVIEQERLLVTKVNTNTNVWFVDRGVGNTTPANHTVVGTLIMSTPFPIVPAGLYNETFHTYAGSPARVCISALEPSTSDPTKFTATVIDGSDGWTRFPP